MAKFYHIYLEAPGLAADDPELTKKLDLAHDWIRYSDHCWIVNTTSNAAKWYARLGDLVKQRDGYLLIVRLDTTDRQGWMPKSVWKWLREQTAA